MENENKIDIRICLGSSCFSRGNGRILQIVKKYLSDNELSDKVFFHGDLCTGNCEHGPIIKINSVSFTEITEAEIIDLLDKELGKLL